MIAQYTAAGIVSQNKQYCTPASADSIESSNGQEDHVSMGANAATKLVKVVDNLYQVLGIELLNASQALHLREASISHDMQGFIDAFRAVVPVLDEDRYLHPDLIASQLFLRGLSLEDDVLLSL
jgi:histidine ammonia-lyase